jgi:hypothetical protein
MGFSLDLFLEISNYESEFSEVFSVGKNGGTKDFKKGLPRAWRVPSVPPSKGRCQSGRMSTLGKRVWQQCHRGFESLPVRQY